MTHCSADMAVMLFCVVLSGVHVLPSCQAVCDANETDQSQVCSLNDPGLRHLAGTDC